MTLGRCRLCRHHAVEVVLKLGRQPVTCHFLVPGEAAAPAYPLALGVCGTCGTVQLMQPFPPSALTPPFDWIRYREPEGHLDSLVDEISRLDGIDRDAVVRGVSFKDRSTVERCRNRGMKQSECLDVHGDLGATSPNANIEAVHAGLTPEVAGGIVARRGEANIVVARHVVEHAAEPFRFINALSRLVGVDGYLILEVPDSSKNLAAADYTMIWEEHVLYLTEDTACALASRPGLEVLSLIRYPYAFEDVLVLVARKTGATADRRAVGIGPDALARSRAQALAYGRMFPSLTRQMRETIPRLAAGRPAALYGAGHLTAAFVNFHGLADLFHYVVDDTLEKQGLRLPNSRLPIVPRRELVSAGVGLCLLGFSPDNEDKVIANNTDFVSAGGMFRSIFADSPRSVRQDIEASA